MFYSTFSKYWNLGKKEACKFASLFKLYDIETLFDHEFFCKRIFL